MSSAFWNGTVIDSPESEPYAVVGDLVVAVRTPRSQDFVTMEVAPTSPTDRDGQRRGGVLLSPRPTPCLTNQWRGEVHLGDAVRFSVGGESYRLTLLRLSEHPAGSPWVNCDFVLERD